MFPRIHRPALPQLDTPPILLPGRSDHKRTDFQSRTSVNSGSDATTARRARPAAYCWPGTAHNTKWRISPSDRLLGATTEPSLQQDRTDGPTPPRLGADDPGRLVSAPGPRFDWFSQCHTGAVDVSGRGCTGPSPGFSGRRILRPVRTACWGGGRENGCKHPSIRPQIPERAIPGGAGIVGRAALPGRPQEHGGRLAENRVIQHQGRGIVDLHGSAVNDVDRALGVG